jgi:hypothetical protein
MLYSYPVIEDPPSSAGALQVKVFVLPSPVERERLCGADGVVGTLGVIELEAELVPDVPLAFVVLIVNVYEVLRIKVPVTVTGLDVPL